MSRHITALLLAVVAIGVGYLGQEFNWPDIQYGGWGVAAVLLFLEAINWLLDKK